jgi:hypothetical protein
MNLRLGGLAKLYQVVALVGREKVIGVNLVELRIHAVDASDTLNEAGGIPRDVVIDDHVGTVEVHTLGQDFGGDQDAVVILRPIGLGVEIGDDIFADAVKRFAGKDSVAKG